jgi:hypothetical protein
MGEVASNNPCDAMQGHGALKTPLPVNMHPIRFKPNPPCDLRTGLIKDTPRECLPFKPHPLGRNVGRHDTRAWLKHPFLKVTSGRFN